MKKLFAFFLVYVFFTTLCVAQNSEPTGTWYGVLDLGSMQLPISFNITRTAEGSYTATMDSPEQGGKDIPITLTTFVNQELTLQSQEMGLGYKGILQDTIIKGNLTQAAQSFALTLSRHKIAKKQLNRPQNPIPPFNYQIQEVTFKNPKATTETTLSGTLTFPNAPANTKFPAVILITGSGPQNRNEEILEHKPFWVIAHHLTQNGIAVLRYDDRGTAHSTGNFETATTNDFATDVEAAITFLTTHPKINAAQIGLIGHSEGGIIAPIVAANNPAQVNFIIMLAGTGIQGNELLLLQQKIISQANKIPKKEIETQQQINKKAFDIVLKAPNTITLQKQLNQYLTKIVAKHTDQLPAGVTPTEYVAEQVKTLSNPWMQNLLKYNPLPTLQKVKCPVLALNGEKDLQVPPQNLKPIQQNLKKGGNNNVTLKTYPNLNHLFQTCTTGSPNEYREIEETIAPVVLDDITQWILKQTLK